MDVSEKNSKAQRFHNVLQDLHKGDETRAGEPSTSPLRAMPPCSGAARHPHPGRRQHAPQATPPGIACAQRRAIGHPPLDGVKRRRGPVPLFSPATQHRTRSCGTPRTPQPAIQARASRHRHPDNCRRARALPAPRSTPNPVQLQVRRARHLRRLSSPTGLQTARLSASAQKP
jgi:hypothetical protein